MPAAQAATLPAQPDEHKTVRLHITPLRPELLKLYLAPSILPLATNISYHTVETFPEKGFGYLELPEAEAQKIKKKLNGTTLRGSKVRIEMAKSEKRKAREEADAAAKDKEEAERPPKRVKKEKKRKEQGVLEGVELENERKVKRGWTEAPSKGKKERKEKKEKTEHQEAKHQQKSSKYTKGPELLFKAKLTPVAATEAARKEKKKDKKEKKEKKSKSREVVVHEFEKNTKTPSFLKETKVVKSTKPPVEYINGQGWVDEDGVVVEPETGKARNRRVLELVDKPVETTSAKPAVSPAAKEVNKKEARFLQPSASSDDESSVVSSSSEEPSSASNLSESDSESEPEEGASTPRPSTHRANGTKQPVSSSSPPAPSTETEKAVHPLEALFKRAKPDASTTTIANVTSTPAKKLTPINTSFSFFDSNNDEDDVSVSVTGSPIANNPPATPFTQKDLEWRGLRSAAPTPDTAAIGRRFSFDWRKGSAEVDDQDDDDDDDDDDLEADDLAVAAQLSQNTKANSLNFSQNSKTRMTDITEEEEETEVDGVERGDAAEEKEESQFRKWFWENRGDLNRAWKKRRRDALKQKRSSENRKGAPVRRRGME